MFFLILSWQAEFAKRQTSVLHESQCEEIAAKLRRLEEAKDIDEEFCKLAREIAEMTKMLGEDLPQELALVQEKERQRWSNSMLEVIEASQEKLESELVSSVDHAQVHMIDGWELDPKVVQHKEWHQSCCQFVEAMEKIAAADSEPPMDHLATACMLVPVVGVHHLKVQQEHLKDLVLKKEQEHEHVLEKVWMSIGKCRHLMSSIAMIKNVVNGNAKGPPAGQFAVFCKLQPQTSEIQRLKEWYTAVAAMTQEKGPKQIAMLMELLLVLQEWSAAPLNEMQKDVKQFVGLPCLLKKTSKFAIAISESFLTALL